MGVEIPTYRLVLNSESMSVPPPPPPELFAMQQERNAIILQARERLHAAFGEEEFTRFDQFVQKRIGSQVKALGTK